MYYPYVVQRSSYPCAVMIALKYALVTTYLKGMLLRMSRQVIAKLLEKSNLALRQGLAAVAACPLCNLSLIRQCWRWAKKFQTIVSATHG